jgi:hypothetical protein
MFVGFFFFLFKKKGNFWFFSNDFYFLFILNNNDFVLTSNEKKNIFQNKTNKIETGVFLEFPISTRLAIASGVADFLLKGKKFFVLFNWFSWLFSVLLQ